MEIIFQTNRWLYKSCWKLVCNNLHKVLFKQIDGIINVAGNVSDI